MALIYRKDKDLSNKNPKTNHKNQRRFSCKVGSRLWKIANDDNQEFQSIQKCKFYMLYQKDEIDLDEGEPEVFDPFSPPKISRACFKLIKYNFTHSHPLSLEFERMSYIN